MCNKCDGTGRVYRKFTGAGGYEVMGWMYCDCDDAQRARYSGIPEEGLYWTFANFPGGKAGLRQAQTAANMPVARWAVLMGPVGTGKSSLAVCAYKQIRDAGLWTAKFKNAALLLDATKKTFGRDDLINPLEALYEDCQFLVLDGLGERQLSEWEIGAMQQLIGQRYTRRTSLVTWITTNWDVGQFKQILGDWVYDRLQQVATMIVLDGKSLRRDA